ncbi:MAG: GNAT family N-acetyltransferase [Hymenobacteraceae bacterium]|nr:GNAT family N-acetyltransferase [Hymenobacteraceae bacterium]
MLEPSTPEEFDKYYRLRYEVLRQPWNQPEGSEKAEDDATAFHALLLTDTGEAAGVCRMHLNTPQQAQLRFMAIAPAYQGQRLGEQLLRYFEEKARKMGVSEINFQARENAVNFYKRNGYSVVEKTYVLFGSIQHYLMQKEL